MFQDMDALIIQQDETTAHIEEQGAQVVEDTSGGNKELASAIDLAKGRNRKKWWCFLIVGMCLWSRYIDGLKQKALTHLRF